MEWGIERAVDVDRLLQRMHWYGQRHGVQTDTLEALESLVRSPTMQYLLDLPEREWFDVLVNDAYKASMHRMYAASMQGVTAQFALHVRRSPVKLHELGARHPHLMQQLQAKVEALSAVQPYGPAVQLALAVHMPRLQLTREMVARAELHGVARPVWSTQYTCDPINSTSNDTAITGERQAPAGSRVARRRHEDTAGDCSRRPDASPGTGLLTPASSCDSLGEQATPAAAGNTTAASNGMMSDTAPSSLVMDNGTAGQAGGSGVAHMDVDEVDYGDNRKRGPLQAMAAEPAGPSASAEAPSAAVPGAAQAGSVAAAASGGSSVQWAEEFVARVSEECTSGQVGPWVNRRDNDCACIAAGPVEAASHTETSCMQLVQEAVICAQVLDIRAHNAQAGAASASAAGVSAAANSGQQQQEQQSGTSVTPGSTVQWPDRTELLASSLAHLAGVIDTLNGTPHGLSISLFAGRRASDRLFLVLQNLAFAQLVRGYQGTSSIYAAAMLNKAWDAQGLAVEERMRLLGPLTGTHAHEMSSIAQQLLAQMDWQAGQAACTQGNAHAIPLSSLLAHLLFLAASGDLSTATALPDTFGTPAWLAVALAADVPQEFMRHMQEVHGQVVPAGAKCFDLFRVWRIDSGSYAQVADMVVSAWEQRCDVLRSTQAAHEPLPPAPSASTSGNSSSSSDTTAVVNHGVGVAADSPQGGEEGAAGGSPLPPPVLMHSNLGSPEEVLQVAQLPSRIRPHIAAFGSLADGFYPLVPPSSAGSSSSPAPAAAASGQEHPIKMASVVMKAVQARAPKVTVTQLSAVKAGDLPNYTGVAIGASTATATPGPVADVKLEMDPRLDTSSRNQLQQLVASMRFTTVPLDEAAVSRALADAYTMVARDALLQM